MARAQGKKSAYGPELVQRSRAAVINALDVVEKKGKLISELLAEEFEKNPIKFMELAAKFCPRDLNIDGEIRHYDQLTDEQLDAEIAKRMQEREQERITH